MSCDQCRGRDYLCQRCKEGALAERFDGNADTPDEWWVADVEEVYHHCPYSEDERDVARCGEIIEAPVRRSEIDPRRYLDCQVCPECDAALEDDQAETAIPDGGEFERASEIATDGGLEEVFRRETIVGTEDGIAIGEDAVPMADDQDEATEAVLGPDPESYEREEGGSR
ncbi:hypothetical protein [Natronorubrum sp. FCH18a]|uniref:hypothetical protein n=1 Tax=Natronorubrum sp. FCH18a TaxID=3447018 RepID=UPI003F513699